MKTGAFSASLLATLVGTVVAVVLAESLLRMFWTEGGNFYLWPPGYRLEIAPRVDLMPGLEEQGHIYVNSHGIRGPEWSDERESEYRILTVGGSTTESLYINQDDNWSSLLMKNLAGLSGDRSVWVGNLGRAGFNSLDHVAFMQFILDQYDVDAVVMLVGGNDMIHRLMADEGYDPAFIDDKPRFYRWIRNRLVSFPATSELFEPVWYKRTYFYQFLRSHYHVYTDKRNVVRENNGGWIEKSRGNRRKARKTDELVDLQSGLDAYGKNIETIIREARDRSIDLVLLSQPTIWNPGLSEAEESRIWWGLKSEGLYYTANALAAAMDAYNTRLLEVCEKLHAHCIDMASKIPKTSEIFYDDIHYTNHGARYFADTLTGELRAGNMLLFSGQ